MTRILLVEDDPDIAGFIRRGLTAEGHSVDVRENGRDALTAAALTDYPLIVLDLMLPLVGGLDVCRALRQGGSQALILMLTAKDSLADKVGGLKAGADDYLTKPFAFDELVARLEALMRRAADRGDGGLIEVANLAIDRAARTVTRGDQQIPLTDTEFRLLRFLAGQAGNVVDRTQILRAVWETDVDPQTNIVDVYIRRLRRKIEMPDGPQLIATVRGVGYRLSGPQEVAATG